MKQMKCPVCNSSRVTTVRNKTVEQKTCQKCHYIHKTYINKK